MPGRFGSAHIGPLFCTVTTATTQGADVMISFETDGDSLDSRWLCLTSRYGAGAPRQPCVAPTRMAAGRRAVTRCSSKVAAATLERMVTVLFSVDDDRARSSAPR